MREIKFRGKRIDNGEWVYGFYGYKAATEQHFIMFETLHQETMYGSYFTDYEVDPETVGQRLDVKDIAFEELYDGDIINLDGYNGDTWIIQLAPYGPQLVDHVGGGDDVEKFDNGDWYHGMFFELDKARKIGNIYDNKELIP